MPLAFLEVIFLKAAFMVMNTPAFDVEGLAAVFFAFLASRSFCSSNNLLATVSVLRTSPNSHCTLFLVRFLLTIVAVTSGFSRGLMIPQMALVRILTGFLGPLDGLGVGAVDCIRIL